MRMAVANNSGAVLWHVDGRGVANLILNRPEVNNAYNGELIAGLLNGIAALQNAEGVRAILLKGNGRHFQAGADLKWINEVRLSSPAANLSASRATAEAVQRLNRLALPTIALVQGGCFGGGTGIIAACDVVIAADAASFSIAEVRWGLTPAIILPQLKDAIGIRQIRRYALTGERFGAEEARRIGLVHEIVPQDELEAAATRVIGHLLENAPMAIAQTKSLALESGFDELAPAQLETLIAKHAQKRQSAEAEEGLRSFLEKRPARWRA